MASCQLTKFLNRLRRSVVRHNGAGASDGELLERFIARREESAFEALVRRHGLMVLRVCQGILRNRHDAEDAFQATFLVLVRKANSIRSREALANWLYGVAHKMAQKLKAMNLRQRRKEHEAGMQTKQAAPPEVGEELWDLLHQELPALPDKYRAAIILCDLEGQSYQEAARALGCAEGTVASRLARGRALLAQRLTRRGLSLTAGAVALALSPGVEAACVPTSLVVFTVQAATLVAAGQAVTAGKISARVAALTEGAVRAMQMTKLKVLVASLLMAAALLGGGVGLLVHHTQAGTHDEKTQTGAKGEAQDRKAEAVKDSAQAKTDKDKLQGTWVLEAASYDGEKEENLLPLKWTFAGDELIPHIGGKILQELTYKLNPDKKPKEIDVSGKEEVGGVVKDVTRKAIYELDGNRLKICTSQEPDGQRPTEFKGAKGVELITLAKKK